MLRIIIFIWFFMLFILFFRLVVFVNGFVINWDEFIFFLCVVMFEYVKVVVIFMVDVLNLIRRFCVLCVFMIWIICRKIIFKSVSKRF